MQQPKFITINGSLYKRRDARAYDEWPSNEDLRWITEEAPMSEDRYRDLVAFEDKLKREMAESSSIEEQRDLADALAKIKQALLPVRRWLYEHNPSAMRKDEIRMQASTKEAPEKINVGGALYKRCDDVK